MTIEYTLPPNHLELLELVREHGKAVEQTSIPYGENAFDLLVAMRSNLKRQGWPRDAIQTAINLCMTGDYENLKMFVRACHI